ncbi:MAG TPA: choice-of-anchor D domain-containing protein, partial [Vicinamibacterales bacterium]|nr:choice-of-anchor D domain-containing protein [Vicinamibacterales bacterium]
MIHLDDVDAAFSTTGTWTTYGSSGRGSDVRYIHNSAAPSTATWQFDGISSGVYRVSATWPGADASVRATNAPFTIRETVSGPILHTALVNQIPDPNDFVDDGSAWEDLGVVKVIGNSLFVQLTNFGADNYVIADAIRIERLGDVPMESEIAVEALFIGGVNDNTGEVDYGDVPHNGGPVPQTYRVYNVGTTNLVVQPATAPSGFTITTNFGVNQAITPGSFFDIVVQLDATSVGTFTGEVSFATNDTDENPFNFAVTANVFPPAETPVLLIIDNGATGYSTSGAWVNWTSNGRDGDLQYLSHTADPAGVATWAFTGLSAGQYRVSTTWSEHANRASDAPYFVRETGGGPVLAVKEVNQKVAPNDLNDQGSLWEDLGIVTIHGNTLRVELTSAGADGYVIADAVRIERLGPVPIEPEIVAMSLVSNSPVVDDTGSIDFGDTTQGTPVMRTVRIHNVGSTNLVVQPASAPTGFSVTTNFGVNETIAPGASFDIVVQLDAGSTGPFTGGQVSFATNDGDENPFNFFVSGEVFPSG